MLWRLNGDDAIGSILNGDAGRQEFWQHAVGIQEYIEYNVHDTAYRVGRLLFWLSRLESAEATRPDGGKLEVSVIHHVHSINLALHDWRSSKGADRMTFLELGEGTREALAEVMQTESSAMPCTCV